MRRRRLAGSGRVRTRARRAWPRAGRRARRRPRAGPSDGARRPSRFAGGVAVPVRRHVDVRDDPTAGGHRGPALGCGCAASRPRQADEPDRQRQRADQQCDGDRPGADGGERRGRRGRRRPRSRRARGVRCGRPRGGGRGAGAGPRPRSVRALAPNRRGPERRRSESERAARARPDHAIDREPAAGLEAATAAAVAGPNGRRRPRRAEVVAAVVERALERTDADARRGARSPCPGEGPGGGRGRGRCRRRAEPERGGEQRDQGDRIVVDGPRGRRARMGVMRTSPSGERCCGHPPPRGRTGGVASRGSSARPPQKQHDAAGRRHDKTER